LCSPFAISRFLNTYANTSIPFAGSGPAALRLQLALPATSMGKMLYCKT